MQIPARARVSDEKWLAWRPRTWKQPEDGARRPLATLSAVDFPAPFGPSSASTSPAGHGEVDAVEHLDAAVGGVDVAHLDHGSWTVGRVPAPVVVSGQDTGHLRVRATSSSVPR